MKNQKISGLLSIRFYLNNKSGGDYIRQNLLQVL